MKSGGRSVDLKCEIDWAEMFEKYPFACTSLYYGIRKKQPPKTPEINHKHFLEMLEKFFPNGIDVNSFFSFFDSNEVLIGVYPTDHFEFTAFSKNNIRILICNDLDNRVLASEKAILFALELLDEKLNCLKQFDTG